MRNNTQKMVRMAILSAISLVLIYLVRIPFPPAPFLVYDPADVPLLIGTFMYGPIAGLVMTIVVSLIQAMVLSSDGWVGFIMHVIATGTLVLVAGTVYRFWHSFWGALVGLILGSLAMTLGMVQANLFFTVKFFHVPIEQVKALLPTAIIPFNLIKSFGNSFITTILYKQVANLLRKKSSASITNG